MWDQMLGLRELLARAGPVAGVALIASALPGTLRRSTSEFRHELCDAHSALTVRNRQIDSMAGPLSVYTLVSEHHRQLVSWPHGAASGDIRRVATRTLSECACHESALEVARVVDAIGYGRVHPLVRLWLAITRAYVHASLEQVADCRRYLDAAVRYLDAAERAGDPKPGSIAFYERGHLSKWSDHCMLALAVSDPGLAAGANGALEQAYAVAGDTGPPRNLRKVSDLRVQLRPFRNTRAVRELDEQILTGS